MNFRTAFLLLIVLAIAALAALNWTTLAAPAVISLGLTVVTAPLGLVMLGLTALLGVFFLVYVLYLQSTVLLDARRHTKEMQAQRELADKAEVSRFTDLRTFIAAEQSRFAQVDIQSRNAMFMRLDDMERGLMSRQEQSDNATAAYMGQLEDRLERRASMVK